jgi:hypothetical protein
LWQQEGARLPHASMPITREILKQALAQQAHIDTAPNN